ncbi:hypothetical protein [Myxococcus sp. CA040A]|uniref:hypothetical protein n=1 Tax=Myxococcus sp. CA040A TaxID=2741738 RepID=UPI00157ABD69|nr:hypothetical protein [Myxococcus sp. CA040A]NTX00191.1 hypothetical protein [Myxococcus sp. CA040A]
MPMVDCESHGLVEAAFYCAHIESCLRSGVACEVDMDLVFDDFGDACLLCVTCLAVAREYVRAHQTEFIDAYPIELEGGCIDHLKEWSEKVNNVDLDALLKAAVKRTRRRPER